MSPEELFDRTMKFGYFILHRHFPSLSADEDAKQTAMLALWIACKKFDETRGVSITSFASRCIINALTRYVKRQSSILHTIYLDDAVKDTKSDNMISIEDTVADPQADTTSVVDSLSSLSLLEEQVLAYYIKTQNQQQCAEYFNVSQSCICRILKSVRGKLER